MSDGNKKLRGIKKLKYVTFFTIPFAIVKHQSLNCRTNQYKWFIFKAN